jgi:dTDP-3-amino-2,3,6-trideoxy-4-keto-D-glucose/dTDP-3-amino-3,4,6-trideoxy-alpha-D-glucose/dTDP-2,6-dideoxy-D-kanosamine transaminase
MRVPFSFLTEQFENSEPIFSKIRDFLKRCDFTLGEDLAEFENRYAAYCGAKHAIGVGSGTDALALSLRAAGVGIGDEVISAPNSFVATTGAIVQVGAKPSYVDVGPDQTLDVKKIEAAITAKTKAIMPVHWAGAPAHMEEICAIADKHRLVVIEDACQALGARIRNKHVGTFGLAGGFSTHPIKPLHVWGDGGLVVTNSDKIAAEIRLIRNHGLEGRDVVKAWGVNSRFDNLHAIVGNYVVETLDATLDARIGYAKKYDAAFLDKRFSKFIQVPPRNLDYKHVFHLYIIKVERRDQLLEFLKGKGVEAKVHYPIPLHLQPAAAPWKLKKGMFPVTEAQSDHTVTLPCHQYLEAKHISYVIDCISEFYSM